MKQKSFLPIPALVFTSCTTFRHDVVACYPDYLQQYATPPSVTLPTNLHYRFSDSFGRAALEPHPAMANSATPRGQPNNGHRHLGVNSLIYLSLKYLTRYESLDRGARQNPDPGLEV